MTAQQIFQKLEFNHYNRPTVLYILNECINSRSLKDFQVVSILAHICLQNKNNIQEVQRCSVFIEDKAINEIINILVKTINFQLKTILYINLFIKSISQKKKLRLSLMKQ